MGFLDKIIRFFEEFTSGGIDEAQDETDGFRDTSGFDDVSYIRKYVSGLLYCNGQKVNYYALTFEGNNIDREQELLNEIESETSETCSQMRRNHGYSEEEGYSDSDTPQYPKIEVGTL